MIRIKIELDNFIWIKNIINVSSKRSEKIRSKLDNIYKISLSKNDIDKFEEEIIQIVKKFNKKNPKKEKNISEKTSLIISYADSIYLNKKKFNLII